MKTMTRITALMLCLTLVCALLPGMSLTARAESFSGTCGAEGNGSNLTWSFDDETGLLTISGSGFMKDFNGEKDVPWNEYRGSVTAISLPEGLTDISTWAFSGCDQLTDVEIPEGVKLIDAYAFAGCIALHTVCIPSTVETIEHAAFASTALTNVTVPYGVKTIGNSAFSNCADLESVVLPDSITGIGSGAFSWCSSLTHITLPAGLTQIEECTFQLCTALKSISIPDSVESIGEFAVSYCSSLNDVTIGSGVKTIGNYAFAYCANLNKMLIPGGVESIGEMAVGYKQAWDGLQKDDRFLICGFEGTAAQRYAEENGFLFCRPDYFTDVNVKDYFFNPVMWAVSHEPQITAGVGDGQFGSDRDCTREQIVTFLWAANGKPEPAAAETTFSDVSPDAWYYKPVMWAVENGITSGMGDGSFGVGQPCTRAQAMTFLYAAKERPLYMLLEDNPFSDVNAEDWYYDAVLWAYSNGVTAGMGDGSFGAYRNCTRAQIITFLYKAYVILHERE